MQTLAHIALTMGLAFVVGFATRRGTICAVIAARQLVLHGRATRLAAFAVAACVAGAVMLPFAWYVPNWAALSPGYPVTITVLVCGVVFGLGAYINDACAFGTLAHLTGGDTDYTGTIVGVVLGALCVPLLDIETVTSHQNSVLSAPQVMSWLLWVFFAAVAGIMLVRYLRADPYQDTKPEFAPSTRRWHPGLTMIVIGIAGGLLHATAGEWTYMAVLSRRAVELVEAKATMVQLPALAGIAALLVGGISAARLSGTFVLKPIQPLSCFWKIIGGALMGASSALIPGGNDVLLLYGLPSLAPHAVAAYLALTLGLIVIFTISKRVMP